MESDINDKFKYFESNYYLFKDFMDWLSDKIKNNDKIRDYYITTFKKYKEQISNTEYNYLKEDRYEMRHSDHSKPTCSLKNEDVLNIRVNDKEYNKIIIDALEKREGFKGPHRLIEILKEYNYPIELAELKASIDFINTTKNYLK